MGKRILIVEEQRHIRTLLHSTLEPLMDQGVEVLSAQTGTEALAVINQKWIDAAFIGLSVRDPGAPELCRQLRNDPASQSVHVVILADKGREGDANLCVENGADEFISVPFDPDELVERICFLLGFEVD